MNATAAFRWVPSAALAACLALLALGFGGRLHPALDSFGHFRAQLGVVSFGLSLLVLAMGARGPGAVGALAALAALWTVWPAYVAPGRTPAPDGGEVFRLLHLNLRFDNSTPQAVFALVARESPDVLALNEVSATWRERLPRLFETYPFRLVCDAPNRIGGVAILSRHPWANGSGEPRCRERGAFAVASVALGGASVKIAALHLGWPWPHGQAWQAGRLQSEFADLDGPAILVGDFNAAPWSATASRVREAGGLQSVPGLGSTWLHRSLPRTLLPLGLPIDQAMTKGVAVHGARTLAPAGSDHLPVLLEFSAPR